MTGRRVDRIWRNSLVRRNVPTCRRGMTSLASRRGSGPAEARDSREWSRCWVRTGMLETLEEDMCSLAGPDRGRSGPSSGKPSRVPNSPSTGGVADCRGRHASVADPRGEAFLRLAGCGSRPHGPEWMSHAPGTLVGTPVDSSSSSVSSPQPSPASCRMRGQGRRGTPDQALASMLAGSFVRKRRSHARQAALMPEGRDS